MVAVQASGRSLTTIEGLGEPGDLHPVQQAFSEEHGLQCGFCTPGFIVSIASFLDEVPGLGDRQLRERLSATYNPRTRNRSRALRRSAGCDHGRGEPICRRDAADLVVLDIDKLPAVIGVEDALEANAPLLYPDWGTNILSPLGVEINELPLDPSRIWQLIAENRRGVPFVS